MQLVSNSLVFNPLKRLINSVGIASGTVAGTKTLIATGVANSSIVYDILLRNFDGTNARNFNVWIGTNNTSFQNNEVQILVPANAGNNGVVTIASLASLVPQLFQNSISGDRYFILEDVSYSVWLENTVTLTANVGVTVNLGTF